MNSVYLAQRIYDGQEVIYNMEPYVWRMYCSAINALYKPDTIKNLLHHFTDAVDSGIVFC